MSLTPKQLRDIAWTLDKLTDLTLAVLEPLAHMESINAATGSVTVELTREPGKPLTQADARKLLAWVKPTQMQADLRAEADELERAGNGRSTNGGEDG